MSHFVQSIELQGLKSVSADLLTLLYRKKNESKINEIDEQEDRGAERH